MISRFPKIIDEQRNHQQKVDKENQVGPAKQGKDTLPNIPELLHLHQYGNRDEVLKIAEINHISQYDEGQQRIDDENGEETLAAMEEQDPKCRQQDRSDTDHDYPFKNPQFRFRSEQPVEKFLQVVNRHQGDEDCTAHLCKYV